METSLARQLPVLHHPHRPLEQLRLRLQISSQPLTPTRTTPLKSLQRLQLSGPSQTAVELLPNVVSRISDRGVAKKFVYDTHGIPISQADLYVRWSSFPCRPIYLSSVPNVSLSCLYVSPLSLPYIVLYQSVSDAKALFTAAVTWVRLPTLRVGVDGGPLAMKEPPSRIPRHLYIFASSPVAFHLSTKASYAGHLFLFPPFAADCGLETLCLLSVGVEQLHHTFHLLRLHLSNIESLLSYWPLPLLVYSFPSSRTVLPPAPFITKSSPSYTHLLQYLTQ
ncbi:hypothetical protein V8C42DRAFT_218015 [Trichoderma barbatum]